MEQIRLDGQVVVITGAGRGLGYTYAKLLAERGAKLVINDINDAEKTVAELKEMGADAIADNHDISKKEGAEALIVKAVSEFGKLDVVVNNAGVCRNNLFEDEDDAVFDFIMKVNVYGSRNIALAAYKVMKEQGYGKIINTTSTAGLYGIVKMCAYSTSKGAIYGMTRCMAQEGAAYGIQVNAIAPGAATPMCLNDTGVDPSLADRVAAAMPPELVAPAIVYLASKECTFTGKIIESCAGRVSEAFMGTTIGFVDFQMTPESLAENWEDVVDKVGYHIIEEGLKADAPMMEAIAKQEAKKAKA